MLLKDKKKKRVKTEHCYSKQMQNKTKFWSKAKKIFKISNIEEDLEQMLTNACRFISVLNTLISDKNLKSKSV